MPAAMYIAKMNLKKSQKTVGSKKQFKSNWRSATNNVDCEESDSKSRLAGSLIEFFICN